MNPESVNCQDILDRIAKKTPTSLVTLSRTLFTNLVDCITFDTSLFFSKYLLKNWEVINRKNADRHCFLQITAKMFEHQRILYAVERFLNKKTSPVELVA